MVCLESGFSFYVLFCLTARALNKRGGSKFVIIKICWNESKRLAFEASPVRKVFFASLKFFTVPSIGQSFNELLESPGIVVLG